jgi:hypothetical protein
LAVVGNSLLFKKFFQKFINYYESEYTYIYFFFILGATAYQRSGSVSQLLVSCPLVHRQEVNDNPTSLGVTCGQQIKSSAVVGFLDQNYCYGSVTAVINGCIIGEFNLLISLIDFLVQIMKFIL